MTPEYALDQQAIQPDANRPVASGLSVLSLAGGYPAGNKDGTSRVLLYTSPQRRDQVSALTVYNDVGEEILPSGLPEDGWILGTPNGKAKALVSLGEYGWHVTNIGDDEGTVFLKKAPVVPETDNFVPLARGEWTMIPTQVGRQKYFTTLEMGGQLVSVQASQAGYSHVQVGQGERHLLIPGYRSLIGRHPDNDIVVDGDFVSNVTGLALPLPGGRRVGYRDLLPTNPTKVMRTQREGMGTALARRLGVQKGK